MLEIALVILGVIGTLATQTLAPRLRELFPTSGERDRGRVLLLQLLMEVKALRSALDDVERRWTLTDVTSLPTLLQRTEELAQVHTLGELRRMLTLLPAVVRVVEGYERVRLVQTRTGAPAQPLDELDRATLESAKESVDEAIEAIESALKR